MSTTDPKSERDLAMAQHGWQRECDAADELLRLMFPGRDADEFRTDGGSINLPNVRHAYAERCASLHQERITKLRAALAGLLRYAGCEDDDTHEEPRAARAALKESADGE